MVNMVVYHALWNLGWWKVWMIDFEQLVMRIWQVGILGSFLVLVGISWMLKYEKLKSQEKDERQIWRAFARQGLWIGMWAVLLSVGTFIFVHEAWIRWGVLHMIAVGTSLAPIFLKLPYPTAWGVGTVVFAIFWDVCVKTHFCSLSRGEPIPGLWLIGLGRVPSNWQSVDFVPVMPWLGVMLLGVGLGRSVLQKKDFGYSDALSRRHTDVKENLNRNDLLSRILYLIGVVGRHALVIYLLHQPILWSVWFLLGWMNLV